MRGSSSRLWSELKKEMTRSTSLVWVVALLLWLALTSSRYSHWHTLSYDLLHNKWLSSAGTDNADHERLQKSSWIHRLQENSTHIMYEDGYNESIALNDGGYNDSIALDDVVDTVASTLLDKTKYRSELGDDTELLVKKEELSPPSTPQEPDSTCASVEEMGMAASGTVGDASSRVREMINNYFSNNGASSVRVLPAGEFCRRGFVFGRAAEDGFGNEIYKILTAAGLSIILNRSLIIAEHGSVNPRYFGQTGRIRLPFGDYLKYSDETFSLSEVKRLWVKHDCAGAFRRPLTMITDDFQRPTRTKVLCEDYTKWQHPIIWFKGTTDSNALQFFLKNRHTVVRNSALQLLGDPAIPSARSNVFGELFRALIAPAPVIEDAVHWVLQGLPDPDFSVHMRMLNSRSKAAVHAACSCLRTLLKSTVPTKTLPRIVLVSDTPSVIREFKEQLRGLVQVIHFDYKMFMETRQNLSRVMSEKYFQPPEKRVKDWGSMPRWVAIVDLFLASRAKRAVISGANRRVGTTYAQLVASLAAARNEQTGDTSVFGFYSSFQSSLLADGLAGQRGWGHTWRRFAGQLSCKNQTAQCARTPLLPYAWWDGPWQSPAPRDVQRMLAYGVKLSDSGKVQEGVLEKRCALRKAALETVELVLPSCKRLKSCH